MVGGGGVLMLMGDVEENVINCFIKGFINHGILADLTNFLRKEWWAKNHQGGLFFTFVWLLAIVMQ